MTARDIPLDQGTVAALERTLAHLSVHGLELWYGGVTNADARGWGFAPRGHVPKRIWPTLAGAIAATVQALIEDLQRDLADLERRRVTTLEKIGALEALGGGA